MLSEMIVGLSLLILQMLGEQIREYYKQSSVTIMLKQTRSLKMKFTQSNTR